MEYNQQNELIKQQKQTNQKAIRLPKFPPLVSNTILKFRMKHNVFFFVFASRWQSVHGREQNLRSVQSSTQCEGSTVGWVDVDGDGCGWYEVNDLPGCPYFGQYDGANDVSLIASNIP